MAEGVNTGPSFVAPLSADPKEGVSAIPSFVAPQTKDSKEGVAAIPSFVAPAEKDDFSASDVPTPVEPQDIGGSSDGAEEVASVSIHEAIFMPRSTTGFGTLTALPSAQGPRVKANLFYTAPAQNHADTDGYAITIVNPDNVKAKSAVVEGNVTPRARIRGQKGGPY